MKIAVTGCCEEYRGNRVQKGILWRQGVARKTTTTTWWLRASSGMGEGKAKWKFGTMAEKSSGGGEWKSG
ncbi:hypothetical protein ACOSP7_006139 [Xanthoceras sorbifolium]